MAWLGSGPVDTAERIDQLFARWDKPDSPGAALLVLQGDRVVYRRGYGSANLEYDIPITSESVFHVASVSKQFTAMAIALLAHEGKLSLNDDIHLYLPEVPDVGATITISHLLHHTSGLRDQWELLIMAGWRMDDVITREHIMKMVRHQKELNFAPGTEYLYCNTGYSLLALIVERISGQGFRQFTAERIFNPLGMSNTHFHDDHEEIVRNRAYSYAPLDGGGFRKSVLNYANVGATSLFTTADDLAKWLVNFDHPTVGGPAVIEQMHERFVLTNGETIPYALGLSFTEHKGLKVIGHSGADAGYRSFCGRIPEYGLGVVILSNLSTFVPYGLAMQVAEVVLAEHLTAGPEQTPAQANVDDPATSPSLSQEQLTDYVGHYSSEELRTTYTVVCRDGGLVVQHQRHDDFALLATDLDTFQATRKGAGAWKLVFTREEGRVTGFKLSSGRVRNIRFTKVAE